MNCHLIFYLDLKYSTTFAKSRTFLVCLPPITPLSTRISIPPIPFESCGALGIPARFNTLFSVDSERTNDSFRGGNFSYGNDLGDLFETTGTNVFLVKVSKWFSL